MKSPSIFDRLWESMPHIFGRSLMGAGILFGLIVVGTVATNTISSGFSQSLAGELTPTVSVQSADSEKLAALKRRPESGCSTDSQCSGGQMCYSGQCKSIFECKPFVDARWQSGIGPDNKGLFEVRNPEYVTMVPASPSVSRSDAQAVRFTGGTLGTHTFERVLLKKFDQPKEVWGGVVEVNPKNLQHYTGAEPVVFVGGYTDSAWPESGSGTWWRDVTVTLTNNGYVPSSKPGKKSGVGGNSFWHDASGPNVVYAPFWVLDAQTGWQDRYIKVEWYVTSEHKFYMRVDGKQWNEANSNPNPISPEYYKFKGFSVGWVSARSTGSLDVKSVRLYDTSCFPASELKQAR